MHKQPSLTKSARRRRARRNNPQNSINQANQTIRSPFRAIFTQGTASNSTAFVVSELPLVIANLGTRVIDLGDVFSEFRISNLQVNSVLHQFASGTTAPDESQGTHTIAFTATDNLSFVTPTTIAQVVDMPLFDHGNVYQKLTIHTGPSGLYQSSPNKWYNTSSAGIEYCAGTVIYTVNNGIAVSGVTCQQYVVVAGEIEFRSPIDPALVPLSVLQREKEALEQRIELARNRQIDSEWFDSKSVNGSTQRDGVADTDTVSTLPQGPLAKPRSVRQECYRPAMGLNGYTNDVNRVGKRPPVTNSLVNKDTSRYATRGSTPIIERKEDT